MNVSCNVLISKGYVQSVIYVWLLIERTNVCIFIGQQYMQIISKRSSRSLEGQ